MGKLTKGQETTDLAVVEPVQNTALMVDDYDSNIMQNMDLGHYYSIVPETQEEKIALYNAINNPDKRLGDHINMVIEVKDILVEVVQLEQEETGELQNCPRIIIIDSKGTSYQCVSVGIFSALKRIMTLFGEPRTWKAPIKIKVLQTTKGERKMLTLELVK